MANLNPNSTDYFHSFEPNTNDLTMAMDYTEDGKPAIRVLSNIQGDIIIEGEVTIPGEVTIANDHDNPLHCHIDEMTPVDIQSMPEVSVFTDSGNTLNIAGTVYQGTDPWNVTGNVNATIVGSPAVGSNKPFYLEVAQGLISGYSFNHKFGAVPSMSNGATGSIWDINDTIYPWDALNSVTGSIVNIERNNTADTGLVVTVQGLDENYEEVSEDITITGADQTGSQLFTRVNRAFVVDAGGVNTGNIDIEAGAAGGTTVARITAGYGQTLMAVYTVPAGKTGYILHGTATGSSDTDASGSMRIRYFGTDTFRIGHAFELQLRGGQYDYTFQVPIPIPEKTDIDVRAIMRSNNKRITAAFDILLVDN